MVSGRAKQADRQIYHQDQSVGGQSLRKGGQRRFTNVEVARLADIFAVRRSAASSQCGAPPEQVRFVHTRNTIQTGHPEAWGGA
jgi:hypothetical protein